jgi:hypothetical protein
MYIRGTVVSSGLQGSTSQLQENELHSDDLGPGKLKQKMNPLYKEFWWHYDCNDSEDGSYSILYYREWNFNFWVGFCDFWNGFEQTLRYVLHGPNFELNKGLVTCNVSNCSKCCQYCEIMVQRHWSAWLGERSDCKIIFCHQGAVREWHCVPFQSIRMSRVTGGPKNKLWPRFSPLIGALYFSKFQDFVRIDWNGTVYKTCDASVWARKRSSKRRKLEFRLGQG